MLQISRFIIQKLTKTKRKMVMENGKCRAADRKALRFIKIGLRSALKASQADADQYPRPGISHADQNGRKTPKINLVDGNDDGDGVCKNTHYKTQEKEIKLRWNAYRIETGTRTGTNPSSGCLVQSSGNCNAEPFLGKLCRILKKENQAENLRKILNWFCWPHDAMRGEKRREKRGLNLSTLLVKSQRLISSPPPHNIYSEGSAACTAPTWDSAASLCDLWAVSVCVRN